MPLFPTFRRACPYQDDLPAVLEGDWCRMCGQQVHDITGLSDAERANLLGACGGDLCVSYRVPLASAMVAAALVASAAQASASGSPTHHVKAISVPTPIIVTLAGAPMAIPAEQVAHPPEHPDGRNKAFPSPSVTTSADRQSSR